MEKDIVLHRPISCALLMDEPHQHRRCTTLRKFSCYKREVRVTTGNLDPELDFVCPFCKGVYSLFRGRHKLHLKKCKVRIARAAKVFPKLPPPSPPPFEDEVFPVATSERECTILWLRNFPPTHSPL